MGVTIHYKIGLQVGRTKKALDRTEELACSFREQAQSINVPFVIRRTTAHTLKIDIGECETLSFDFDFYENREPLYAGFLSDDFARRILATADNAHLKRWPNQRLMWATGFCKTQFARSLAEHRFVAELVRSLASVAEYAHVHDEGDYYHTRDIDDAAGAIAENGKLIDGLAAQFGGEGVARETFIKPVNLKKCPACKTNTLHPDEVRNALSRYAKAYICSDCGTREAFEGHFWKDNPAL